MFKIGDVVVLRSGGPRMTVEKIDGTTAHCKWFEKDKQKQGAFDAAMLASGARHAVSFR